MFGSSASLPWSDVALDPDQPGLKPQGLTAMSEDYQLTVSAIVLVSEAHPQPQASIASIQNQSHRPLEIIVVQAKSLSRNDRDHNNHDYNDRNYNKHDYSDVTHFDQGQATSPIYWLMAEEPGLAAALNQAIALAQGQVVAVLEAGDRWLAIEHLAESLELLRRQPDVGAVIAGWQWTDGSDRKLSLATPWHGAPKLDVLAWLRWRLICGSTLVIRRFWLKQVKGFDDTLLVTRYVDLMVRLALAGMQTVWLKKVTVARQLGAPIPREEVIARSNEWQTWDEQWWSQPALPTHLRPHENSCRYHLAVWQAWLLHRAGCFGEMAAVLQRSLTYSPYLRSETIGAWVQSFANYSAELEQSFDANSLTQLPEWEKLVALSLPLPELQKQYVLAETQARGLDGQANTVMLYRILGNDLPPRQRLGQTLANLRFILEHEPALPNCEKGWVVNRIVDRDQEAAILQLLTDHKQYFIHVPFKESDYAQCEFDFENYPKPNFLNLGSTVVGAYGQILAIDHTYRFKNLYVMNNNGSRNLALQDGRSRAKWVAPFDGNCFFTLPGWQSVQTTLRNYHYYKYITVPLVRMNSNEELLDLSFQPQALAEPQIIFRCDARETFDERMRYGHLPKVELLKRLRIPGVWDEWNYQPWERRQLPESPEAGQYAEGGWVARLVSGVPETEASEAQRRDSRHHGVWFLLDRLDEQVVRRTFQTDHLLWYSWGAIDQVQRGEAWPNLRRHLVQAADQALAMPLVAITDKAKAPPSGDRRYFWRSGDHDSDHRRWASLCDRVTTLALAEAVTGEPHYSERAAEQLRLWFLSPDQAMRPNLAWALGGDDRQRGREAAETHHLYFLLDAVRLLERSGAWTAWDQAALKTWLRQLFLWLQDSTLGQAARARLDWHGPAFDLQLVAIAAYLDDASTAYKTAHRAKHRLLHQIQLDGSIASDLQQEPTFHHCTLTLQIWLNLAQVARGLGVDLWGYVARDGRHLPGPVAWWLNRHRLDHGESEGLADRIRLIPLAGLARSLMARPKLARRPPSQTPSTLPPPKPSPKPWYQAAHPPLSEVLAAFNPEAAIEPTDATTSSWRLPLISGVPPYWPLAIDVPRAAIAQAQTTPEPGPSQP